MFSAPDLPPDSVVDAHEQARLLRAKEKIRRRNARIRFVATIVAVAVIPAALPSVSLRTPSLPAQYPVQKAISTESVRYDNRPAESPEGESTLRLRRTR